MRSVPPAGGNPGDPFQDPNLGGGLEGSIVPAEIFNAMRDELIHMIQHAGLTPSAADMQQVRKAVQAIIAVALELSSTDNAIARFDGATGELQNSPNGPYVLDQGRIYTHSAGGALIGGLLGSLNQPPGNDLNGVTGLGWHVASGAVANLPTGSGTWFVLTSGDVNLSQIAFRFDNANDIYTRRRVTGAWSGWVRIITENRVQALADWKAGTATLETLVSPEKIAAAVFAQAVPRRALSGFILSNNAGAPTQIIDIGPGAAREEGGAVDHIVSSSTVQIDITDAGDRVDGSSLTANTTYHVLAGRLTSDGSFTAGFSQSLALPTGWRSYRRVGSVRTSAGSGAIGEFVQHGDYFYLKDTVQTFSETPPGTTAQLKAMTVPTGISVLTLATFTFRRQSSVGDEYAIVSSPLVNDQAPSASLFTHRSATAGETEDANSDAPNVTMPVLTDTSGQIRYRVSGTTGSPIFSGHTHGWIDYRGKE